MDKFGIFNILSSLIGNTGVEKDDGNRNFSDGAATQNLQSENAKTDADVAQMRASFKPLQNSMLSAMKNHDEFVKRVRDKNKKQR